MKTMFKSLFVAVLFTVIGTSAFAQLGAQSTVTATARILKQITLTNDSIQFGTIAAGGGATLLSPTGVGSTNVGFTNRAGRLVIDATPDEPVRVEFPDTIALYRLSDSTTIKFRLLITCGRGEVAYGAGTQDTTVFINDQPITSPGLAVTEPGGNGRSNAGFGLITTASGSEKATLFIGGNLYESGPGTTNISASQPTGTYRGAFTFNVLYSGL